MKHIHANNSLENLIFAKSNNWSESIQNATKVKLDLYEREDKLIYQISSQYIKKTTEKSLEN